MAFNWISKFLRAAPSVAKKPAQARRLRFNLERLEDRITPVTSVTNLTQGVTPASMVQSLLGVGVQASNIQYTGAPVAAGTFAGGAATVGFDAGVILSSGTATGVVGPNNNSGFTGSNNTPGDADLDTIVAPNPTRDAAVLEFDFVPAGAILNFQYVFSSEEYAEFVGSPFNDVFAFYLNGVNIALLPGSSTPVSINNVNNGNPPTPPSNPQFFVDNYTSPTLQTQMDGLTVVLTATATVKQGQVNHIKLAIADASDTVLDSNVFIKAGSFSAPKEPEVKVYNPVRFNYNRRTRTFNGLFTLLNTGNASQSRPFYILFTKLPPGASIANATGVTADGTQYMKVNKEIGLKKTIKVRIAISNPLFKPMKTFFIAKNFKFSALDPSGAATAT